jgi:predicted NBD/HSP70 family sugar kinase
MRYVSTMRELDKAVVLDVVRRFGPLSRVEIHNLTHLRPATISVLIRELIGEEKVQEAGLSDNPTGRKQILLRFNEDLGVIVAVDFDVEAVTAAMLNCHPAIRGPVLSEETNLKEGVDGLLRQIFTCVRKVITQSGVDPASILGIGVGDPGVVDPREGRSVISSTIDFWQDIPVRTRFEEEFGIPCVVENSSRNKTMAERMLGAGGRSDDMIFLEYGRGVGAGIISGGHTLRGSGWAAGEFGHTHLVRNGPPCRCGSFGCVEAVTSIGVLETQMKQAISQGGYSQCLALAGGDIDRITGWHVLAAAQQGDKMSVAFVEELGTNLGLGLASLVNLFNPELIVLDKRLSLASGLLLDQISRTVRRQALAYSTEHLQFRFGTLDGEAGLLGAGLTVLNALFEVPALKPPRFLLDHALQTRAGQSAHRRSAAGESPQAHRGDTSET